MLNKWTSLLTTIKIGQFFRDFEQFFKTSKVKYWIKIQKNSVERLTQYISL